MKAATASKTQQWFYSLSQGLLASFRGSAAIEHRVTKGESREGQILDVLQGLLPTRLVLKSKVAIIDSADTESPSFDAVLFDRSFSPLLFVQNRTSVAMIESVVAAIEIKSNLGTGDLEDVFAKARKLTQMKRVAMGVAPPAPRVTAFAYECPNLNLSFYDFSVKFKAAPLESPNLICVLGKGLFTTADSEVRPLSPVDVPEAGQSPILFGTGMDSLFLYLYFLSRWMAARTGMADILRKYGGTLFANPEAFYFDQDFLTTVLSDNRARDLARTAFEGSGASDIRLPYQKARTAMGLTE